MVKGMTLQNICQTKDEADKILNGYRLTGFTGKIIITCSGLYEIYIGSFGARYKKIKKQNRSLIKANRTLCNNLYPNESD